MRVLEVGALGCLGTCGGESLGNGNAAAATNSEEIQDMAFLFLSTSVFTALLS